jgi:hypothetical protein
MAIDSSHAYNSPPAGYNACPREQSRVMKKIGANPAGSSLTGYGCRLCERGRSGFAPLLSQRMKCCGLFSLGLIAGNVEDKGRS